MVILWDVVLWDVGRFSSCWHEKAAGGTIFWSIQNCEFGSAIHELDAVDPSPLGDASNNY